MRAAAHARVPDVGIDRSAGPRATRTLGTLGTPGYPEVTKGIMGGSKSLDWSYVYGTSADVVIQWVVLCL